jgi:pyruvate kinase
MVARGDLGIEIPYEELPIVQRRIVKTCLRHGKPVIVATHMLESMIESPMPTRAEVTDVANAVFEEADAIMLSGETTVGKYPLKCIEVFDRIATRIERSGNAQFHDLAELTSAREKLVKSAVVMANELRAGAVLAFTRHGHMARYAAWMRPRYSPIYGLCDSEKRANELTLCWGVVPFVVEFDLINPQNTIERALKTLLEHGRLHRGMTVVIVGAISVGTEIVDAVQMRVV